MSKLWREHQDRLAQFDMERMEAEANAFALELLMPEPWIRRDAAGVDLADDKAVEKLARLYKVPVAIMAFRIGQIHASGERIGSSSQPQTVTEQTNPQNTKDTQ